MGHARTDARTDARTHARTKTIFLVNGFKTLARCAGHDIALIRASDLMDKIHTSYAHDMTPSMYYAAH